MDTDGISRRNLQDAKRCTIKMIRADSWAVSFEFLRGKIPVHRVSSRIPALSLGNEPVLAGLQADLVQAVGSAEVHDFGHVLERHILVGDKEDGCVRGGFSSDSNSLFKSFFF